MKKYAGIQELTERYSSSKSITKKEAEERVKDLITIIESTIKDTSFDGIQIIGSITLKKMTRKSRVGRNPRNPLQEVYIPSKIGIKVELGKRFDLELNG